MTTSSHVLGAPVVLGALNDGDALFYDADTGRWTNSAALSTLQALLTSPGAVNTATLGSTQAVALGASTDFAAAAFGIARTNTGAGSAASFSTHGTGSAVVIQNTGSGGSSLDVTQTHNAAPAIGVTLFDDATAGLRITGATRGLDIRPGAFYSAGNITIQANGGPAVAFNDGSNAGLTGFTATSIFGALNELRAGLTDISLDGIINAPTPDNDVVVPVGADVVLRDGGGAVVPLTLARSSTSSTLAALNITNASTASGAKTVSITANNGDVLVVDHEGTGAGNALKVTSASTMNPAVYVEAPVGSYAVIAGTTPHKVTLWGSAAEARVSADVDSSLMVIPGSRTSGSGSGLTLQLVGGWSAGGDAGVNGGDVDLRSGSSGNAGILRTGITKIRSDNAPAGGNAGTGDTRLYTGNAQGTGKVGDIEIWTGAAVSGTKGGVTIEAGNGSTLSPAAGVVAIQGDARAELKALTVADEQPKLVIGHDLTELAHINADNVGAVLGLSGTGSMKTQFEVGRYGASGYRVGARIDDPTDANNEAAQWRLDRSAPGIYQGHFSAHDDATGEVGQLFKLNDPSDGTISQIYATDSGHCAAYTVGEAGSSWQAGAVLYSGTDYGSFGLETGDGSVRFSVDATIIDISASSGDAALDATGGVSIAAGMAAATPVAGELILRAGGDVRITGSAGIAGALHVRFNGPEISSSGGAYLYLKTDDTADAKPGAVQLQPGNSTIGDAGGDIFITPGVGTANAGAINLLAVKTPVGGGGAGEIQLAADHGISLQALGGVAVPFNDSTYTTLPVGYDSIMHVLNSAFVIPPGGITDDLLRDSAALSVMGRSANSVGDPGDISTTAGSFGVLRESGGALSFGKVDYDSIQTGSSGDWFGHVAGVADNGVMEVGRYIDFHHTDGAATDFDVRLSTNGVTGDSLFINTTGKIWHSDNDGSGSGLDADLLDGANSSDTNVVSTIAKRSASGDIVARLFRSEYATANPTINYFTTQIATGAGADNYLRPSTPTQVRAALDIDQLGTGTYTPTPVAGSNISGAGAATTHTWAEIQDTDGNKTVHVKGRIQLVTLSSTGSGTLYIPLPVPSNFTNANDLSGVGVFATTNGTTYAYLTADATNDRAQLSVSSTTATSNLTIIYAFSYRVL